MTAEIKSSFVKSRFKTFIIFCLALFSFMGVGSHCFAQQYDCTLKEHVVMREDYTDGFKTLYPISMDTSEPYKEHCQYEWITKPHYHPAHLHQYPAIWRRNAETGKWTRDALSCSWMPQNTSWSNTAIEDYQSIDLPEFDHYTYDSPNDDPDIASKCSVCDPSQAEFASSCPEGLLAWWDEDLCEGECTYINCDDLHAALQDEIDTECAKERQVWSCEEDENGVKDGWSYKCVGELPDLDLGDSEPEEDPCSTPPPQNVGNPISILNGNNYESVTDINLESPFKSGFSFSRSYNSKSDNAGILGHGWTHSYSLTCDPGRILGDDTYIHITDHTGRGVYFSETTPERWDGAFFEETYVTVDGNGYTWHRLNGTTYHFNTQGQLDNISDPFGNTQTLTYDASSRIETITDQASARVLTLGYNASNLVTSISGPVTPSIPAGIWATYDYDENGNLVSVTYADGSGLNYEYSDPNDVHNITAKRDKLDHLISSWDYDTGDRVVSNFAANGKGVDIDYIDYRTVDVTDAYGKTRTYTLTYNKGIPKVESISDPGDCPTCSGSGNPIRYSYDDRFRTVEEEYANGSITHYDNYDEQGNPRTVIKAYGTSLERTIQYTYHPQTGAYLSRTEPSVVGPGNQHTIWDYDNDGNNTPNENPASLLYKLIERGYTKDAAGTVVPYEYVTTYQYNARGLVTSVDGPLPGTQDQTTFTYDPGTGDLLTITNPLGTTTLGGLDAAGNPAWVSDVNDVRTNLSYDARYRLVSTETAGVKNASTYTTAGSLNTVTTGTGDTTSFTYDASYGRLTQLTDSLGNSMQYTYDGQGNAIEKSIYDPSATLRHTISYDYQEPTTPGKLWKIINPDAGETVFSYDLMGNVAFVTDPMSRSTSYLYDAHNRLIQTIEPGPVTTAYAYDSHGNLASVTDPENNTTSYQYDDLARLLSETSPDSGTNSYTYDEAGNMLSRTDAKGVTVSYSYDSLNRLTLIMYPDSEENITYTYDQGTYGKGKLATITDPSGTTAYEYDELGRLVNETRVISGQTFDLGYAYNQDNALTQIDYPSTRTVTYNRDIQSRITDVSTAYNSLTHTLADNITYKPFGPLTGMVLGNGINITGNHDLLYRLTQSQAGSIYNRSYTYNAASSITDISDPTDPLASLTFGYDNLNRLTSATGKHGIIGYTYDDVGNRLTRTVNGLTETLDYQPGTNRLSAINGTEPVSFTYDANGNITAKGETSFTYNQNNRLIKAAVNGFAGGQYIYNAMGQRVVKTADNQTRISIYGPGGNRIAETDEAGNPVAEYVYLHNNPLTMFSYETPTEIIVNIATDTGKALIDVKVYAFTETGGYTGKYAVTDAKGNAVFPLSDFDDGFYKFRADYLSAQFWTDVLSLPESTATDLIIDEEQTEITFLTAGAGQEGIKVYLFSETGLYLGRHATTDAEGKVTFDLPAGLLYKFRADYLGNRYWTDAEIIVADSVNYFDLDTGGGVITLTIEKQTDQPLVGLKTYLFHANGRYLGKYALTDADGRVDFAVSNGEYQIRCDYLGYKFWSDLGAVYQDTDITLPIPHQDVAITVSGNNNGDIQPLDNLKVYLFTPAGSYLANYQTTDARGRALFNLPEKEYKVRVDYLGVRYWSDPLTWADTPVSISEGLADVSVTNMGLPLDGINTYVFNNSGSYLGIKAITGTNGLIAYRLPEGEYNFRADYLGNQYWSDITTIIPHAANPVTVPTGGGAVTLRLVDDIDTSMVGVKCYLFSSSGSYLGGYGVTNDLGEVSFNLADGNYKLRIDYLGYQFWTDEFTVPDISDTVFVIPHQDVVVTLAGDNNSDIQPIAGQRVYLFTPAGSYLGRYEKTDALGRVAFNLPEMDYKVRADYLGSRYWSDLPAWTDINAYINQGIADITVMQGENPVDNVPVYLFTSLGSYLGRNDRTDENGLVSFRLPGDTYKFRANYLGSQYWLTETVVPHQTNVFALNTGGGLFDFTVDKGLGTPLVNVPVYVFNSVGSYLGMNGNTDADGCVSFDLTDGDYKFRINYLGYRFWTEVSTVPDTLSDNLTILHQDAAVTIHAFDGFTSTPLENIRVYLFNGAGSYMGRHLNTDQKGLVSFSLPPEDYKVRVDYLGSQYWSGLLNPGANEVEIEHGQVDLHVTLNNEDVIDAPVYLFSSTGSYLSKYERTDDLGAASFSLPGSTFKFRVDYNGVQYWSPEINVITLDHQSIELALDQLALNLTNDPAPVRFDGKGPVHEPEKVRMANLSSFIGFMPRIVTAQVATEPDVAYYINDHLGTPQILVDESGEVVWHGDYFPFGDVALTNETVVNDFRFPGQYFDDETGLHYNWHRYYDPGTGRYLRVDPIGLGGGINLYRYAGGNPINAIDPWGLFDLIHANNAFRSGYSPTKATREMHFQRNRRKKDVNKKKAEHEWIKMAKRDSIFHNWGSGNKLNEKYVSPDGHHEAVFYSDGKPVTNSVNMATYNYYSPYEAYGMPHIINDVAPYFIWGNTSDDPTSIPSRIWRARKRFFPDEAPCE